MPEPNALALAQPPRPPYRPGIDIVSFSGSRVSGASDAVSEGWQRVHGNAAEIYEQHLVPAMFAPWAPVLANLARLQPRQRVLDIACGTGVVAREAAARVRPRGAAVGLDVNAAMLAVARRAAAQDDAPARWLRGSALALPFGDATFDVVLCQQGLQQFPNRAVALVEMRRVLVPGGRVALSVWSEIERNPGMAALVDALERHVGPSAADNRRAPFALGNRDELRSLLEDAGLREIEIRTTSLPTRFPSPEALVEAQLAATPLAALDAIDEPTRRAIARDVRQSLRPYLRDQSFSVPMEAHLALADEPRGANAARARDRGRGPAAGYQRGSGRISGASAGG